MGVLFAICLLMVGMVSNVEEFPSRMEHNIASQFPDIEHDEFVNHEPVTHNMKRESSALVDDENSSGDGFDADKGFNAEINSSGVVGVSFNSKEDVVGKFRHDFDKENIESATIEVFGEDENEHNFDTKNDEFDAGRDELDSAEEVNVKYDFGLVDGDFNVENDEFDVGVDFDTKIDGIESESDSFYGEETTEYNIPSHEKDLPIQNISGPVIYVSLTILIILITLVFIIQTFYFTLELCSHRGPLKEDMKLRK